MPGASIDRRSLLRGALATGTLFGLDALFLPIPGVDGSLRMGQSNLRSLLHLVKDLEEVLDIESRQVWSESGANFADVLRMALGTYNVN